MNINRKGLKMQQIFLCSLMTCVLFLFSGCVHFNETHRTSSSRNYSLDLKSLGHLKIQTWVSNYGGEVDLLKSAFGESYVLRGDKFKNSLDLKVRNIIRTQMWNLKGFDVFVFEGEYRDGTLMHQIVTISKRKTTSTVLPVPTKVVFRKSNDYKSLIRGELTQKIEDSSYYIFNSTKFSGPLPLSDLRGDVLDFYQSQYLPDDLIEESFAEDHLEPVQIESDKQAEKKMPVVVIPESDYEEFKASDESVIPADRVPSNTSVQKINVKID